MSFVDSHILRVNNSSNKCSPNDDLPVAHFFSPNGLQKRTSPATEVHWEMGLRKCATFFISLLAITVDYNFHIVI